MSRQTDVDQAPPRVMAEHKAIIEWEGDLDLKTMIVEVISSLDSVSYEEKDGGLQVTVISSSLQELRSTVDRFLELCSIAEAA